MLSKEDSPAGYLDGSLYLEQPAGHVTTGPHPLSLDLTDSPLQPHQISGTAATNSVSN